MSEAINPLSRAISAENPANIEEHTGKSKTEHNSTTVRTALTKTDGTNLSLSITTNPELSAAKSNFFENAASYMLSRETTNTPFKAEIDSSIKSLEFAEKKIKSLGSEERKKEDEKITGHEFISQTASEILQDKMLE